MTTIETSVEKIEKIQDDNPYKDIVRSLICKQTEPFIRKYKRLSMLTLPATKWIIEKLLLAFCQENNFTCNIFGIEKSKKVFEKTICNKPEGTNINAFNTCYEKFCQQRNFYKLEINFFWADYCGCFQTNWDNRFEIKYPRLYTFFNEVESRTDPFLYYLTFSLNGRNIKNARKGLNPLGFAQKLKNIIASKARKLEVIPIFQVIYKGTGNQTMITLGFACNMGKIENGNFWKSLHELPINIPFSPVKEEYLDKKSYKKNVEQEKMWRIGLTH